MKRKLLSVVIAGFCLIGIMFSAVAEDENYEEESLPITPFRISFWPATFIWPDDMDVWGLNLGFPGAQGNIQTKVYGLDIGVISETPNVEGAQLALITVGESSKGVQAGVANAARFYEGVQLGLFNIAVEGSKIFQLGLFNQSKGSSGLQIGALNFMNDGLLPVLPLFNYSPIDSNQDEDVNPLEDPDTESL